MKKVFDDEESRTRVLGLRPVIVDGPASQPCISFCGQGEVITTLGHATTEIDPTNPQHLKLLRDYLADESSSDEIVEIKNTILIRWCFIEGIPLIVEDSENQ